MARRSRGLVVSAVARRVAALTVAALALATLADCQRTLDGAPCQCAQGWICCLPSANLCVRAADQCPSAGDDGPRSDASDGSVAGDSPPAERPGAGAGDDAGDGSVVADASDARGVSNPPDVAGTADARDAHDMPDTADALDSADAPDSADASDSADAPTPGTLQAPTASPVCTVDGWCWTNPLPMGEPLVQVWASSKTDVWLLGQAGTVLRWNGVAWSELTVPTSPLSALWGSGPNDVWLGADEGIWHWDGHTFIQADLSSAPGTRPVYAMWGRAANDVWAVGGSTWHWNGSNWTAFAVPNLAGPIQAVWGSASDDVYAGVMSAITAARRMIHWDGQGWTDVASFGAQQIAGVGPRDVLASSSNEIRHWDGGAWAPLAGEPPVAMFGLGTARVGALDQTLNLVEWNGTDWSPLSPAGAAPAPERFRSMWAASAANLWGVSAGGTAARWDGTRWSAALPQLRATRDDVQRVTGAGTGGGAGDVWAVAGGSLLHWDGTGWRPALAASEVGGGIRDLWASAPDDLWLLGGDDRLHRLKGSTWTVEDVPLRGADGPQMIAISGTTDDDVWILRGTRTVLHWTGGAWTGTPAQQGPLSDVWAFGPNRAWVAGNGLSLWFDGTVFGATLPAGSMGPISSVTGTAADDAWAIAGQSLIHYDGHAWSPSMSTGHQIAAVSARAPDDVWVVSPDDAGGTRIYHKDSTAWASTRAPVVLHDVWAAPDGTAWIAGDQGALLRHAR